MTVSARFDVGTAEFWERTLSKGSKVTDFKAKLPFLFLSGPSQCFSLLHFCLFFLFQICHLSGSTGVFLLDDVACKSRFPRCRWSWRKAIDLSKWLPWSGSDLDCIYVAANTIAGCQVDIPEFSGFNCPLLLYYIIRHNQRFLYSNRKQWNIDGETETAKHRIWTCLNKWTT